MHESRTRPAPVKHRCPCGRALLVSPTTKTACPSCGKLLRLPVGVTESAPIIRQKPEGSPFPPA